MAPQFYLISRNLNEDQIHKITDALAITPVDVVLIAQPQDVGLAKNFSEMVTGLHRPIAILADFASPFTAVHENGSLEVINV